MRHALMFWFGVLFVVTVIGAVLGAAAVWSWTPWEMVAGLLVALVLVAVFDRTVMR